MTANTDSIHSLDSSNRSSAPGQDASPAGERHSWTGSPREANGSFTRLLTRVLATDATWSGTIARVTLGLVILPHGLQKTLGVFGGYGFSGTMGFLTETAGLPWLVALAVILFESVGALALILGLGSRLAAAGIAAVMIGAIVTTHLPNGFFMNWSGAQAGEGFEYHLLALGLAAIVMTVGGGRAALDRRLVGSASE